MLIMALMRKVARNHGFRVLLHEKPFKGVNGSGQHNNWSLGTDTGILLLSLIHILRGHGVHRIRELEVTVWYLSVLRTKPISAC